MVNKIHGGSQGDTLRLKRSLHRKWLVGVPAVWGTLTRSSLSGFVSLPTFTLEDFLTGTAELSLLPYPQSSFIVYRGVPHLMGTSHEAPGPEGGGLLSQVLRRHREASKPRGRSCK